MSLGKLGKEILWLIGWMGKPKKDLWLKNAPPCPTTQLLPPFHKNNHRNINCMNMSSRKLGKEI